MPATLVDLAQTSEDPLQAGVAEMFLTEWDPFAIIDYATIGDMADRSIRWSTLPTVGYRAINGSYTESTGTFEQQEETLSIVGGDVDVDIQLENNKTQVIDMMGEQTRMKVKALAYHTGNNFVNGDKATDPLEVDGLNIRVGNLPSRQTISFSGTTDSLKVYASASTLNQFFDNLSDALSKLDGGICDFIIADETSVQGIFSAMRRLSVPANQGDMMSLVVGGTTLMFPTLSINGQTIPVVRAGFTDSDQATKVITTTEDPGDGGTDSTSIYFVRTSGERMFKGLQKRDLEVRPIGELQGQPANRVRIEWVYGYSNYNDRCLVVGRDMKFAAS